MRRLDVCELRDSILLPASAVALDVFVGRLLYSFDPDDAAPTLRNFAEFRPCDDLPDHARFVGTYGAAENPAAVFDITPREPDVPATPDLPDAERSHFVALWRDGFRLRADRAWIAPDDEPLTTEQIIAVATLQERGYGAVVSA